VHLSNNLFHILLLNKIRTLFFSYFTHRFLTPALLAKYEGQSSPCLLHICTFIKGTCKSRGMPCLHNFAITYNGSGQGYPPAATLVAMAKPRRILVDNDLPPLRSYSIPPIHEMDRKPKVLLSSVLKSMYPVTKQLLGNYQLHLEIKRTY
jgi:hypothetical protein